MGGYAVVLAIAAVTTLLATPVVRMLAIRFGAVVAPSDARHVHTRPTPTLGGEANGSRGVLDEKEPEMTSMTAATVSKKRSVASTLTWIGIPRSETPKM